MAFASSFTLTTSSSSLTCIKKRSCGISTRTRGYTPSAQLRCTSFFGAASVDDLLGPGTTDRGTVRMALGKVVVAGGTGFVGSRLVRALLVEGASVTVLTRNSANCTSFPLEVTLRDWSPPDGVDIVADTIKDASLVVSLAGAPVVQRWSESGKKDILSSRVDSTTLLAKAVESLSPESRPRAVVCASAVGYYGSEPTMGDALDESSPSGPDNDFLVNVCKQWEAAAAPIADLTRLVILRLGVVLAPGGGALARMVPAFQVGAGGPVGSGMQAVSWVHADDVVQMVMEAGNNESVSGVYNATGPQPATMKEMSQALASALNRPCIFPVPGLALKLVYGDGAQVVLEGQTVKPSKWLSHGLKFKYETVEQAMVGVAQELNG